MERTDTEEAVGEKYLQPGTSKLFLRIQRKFVMGEKLEVPFD